MVSWSLVSPQMYHIVNGYLELNKTLMDIINKYKVVLVVKGFHQRHDFDFTKTTSPVVKPILESFL